MKLDINKFSFPQLVSNSNGKTSGSGFCGVISCMVGCIAFLYGGFTKDSNLVNQSIVLVGMSVTLLGYRKSKEAPNEGAVQTTEETPDSVPEVKETTDTTTTTTTAESDQPLNS